MSYIGPDDIAHIIDDFGVRALYQIIVKPDGMPVGVEVLARLHHPNHGMITPNRFIEVAESNGLINQIGAQIMDLGVAAAAVLGPSMFVSINVSPIQLYQTSFPDDAKKVIEKYGVPPDWVELEITEMALIKKNGVQFDAIHRLIDSGFKLAIDDFGVGWSGLSLVRSAPFSRIKIDQSFVAKMMETEKDRIIIDHLVKLAQRLDLSITVEGVETADQALYLNRYPDIHMQGYFFGRPVPLEDILSRRLEVA
jgi:EAL domain-containing protein (putative c-di-GMP-specific phosphodiesterase class I)